jgi:hypothetical protein
VLSPIQPEYFLSQTKIYQGASFEITIDNLNLFYAEHNPSNVGENARYLIANFSAQHLIDTCEGRYGGKSPILTPKLPGVLSELDMSGNFFTNYGRDMSGIIALSKAIEKNVRDSHHR